jgi:acyl-lipid omega-6 desaturase (Delta-12 desaturase)
VSESTQDAGDGSRKARAYWRESVADFERPSVPRAILDLLLSAVAYVALMVCMYLLVADHLWLALALSVPTAGFLLRTFIVFHDCAHGSFLPGKRANLWVGRITALLVFQPFANWRHNHAVHHGTSGDLDRRGQGDVQTLTVAEYAARDRKGRLAYRLFRSPAVLFTIGPLWSLLFGPRFWNKNMRPVRSRASG